MAGLAKTTLTRKQSSKSGNAIVCSYTNSKTYANLTLDVGTVKGVSASAFAMAMGAQAKAQHATLKTIHGVGTSAVEFTENDAKGNADGIASTTVAALDGDKEIVVVATLPTANVVAIAHAISG